MSLVYARDEAAALGRDNAIDFVQTLLGELVVIVLRAVDGQRPHEEAAVGVSSCSKRAATGTL